MFGVNPGPLEGSECLMSILSSSGVRMFEGHTQCLMLRLRGFRMFNVYLGPIEGLECLM